jgi:PAS domain-containing protein
VLDVNSAFKSAPDETAYTPARVGTWECQLPFETLTWSDEVYDLFELPRGMRVTRTEALGFYSDESRRMLEAVRLNAIEHQTGFVFEAEIHTALGKTRWMRITASVEYENGVPQRLFGTKQDITAERQFGAV